MPSSARFDAIVIGAGFSGLYALHRLRAQPVHRAGSGKSFGGMYMGYTAGIPEYRRRCDEIAAGGYTGFKLA